MPLPPKTASAPSCMTGEASAGVAMPRWATAQPIYISKDDVFSDATAREILKHNLTGRKLCGW